ncbi:Os05g0380850 [Oryza sativa Japonica Group]|uniref:Os05g0380850 protein n=1 Tax=Oryza sativa subsp. japonica TaxID=39947 RepID=A0A0P0WLM2_ORYSJ|nr:hypothetical protein EE612_029151 [Oryza sativa]BAS93763.1 Os05g0380850 [Oryza sativa Japonica Group]
MKEWSYYPSSDRTSCSFSFNSSSFRFGRAPTPQRCFMLVRNSTIFSSSGAAPFLKLIMSVSWSCSTRKFLRCGNSSVSKVSSFSVYAFCRSLTQHNLGSMVMWTRFFFFNEVCLRVTLASSLLPLANIVRSRTIFVGPSMLRLSRTLGGCIK